MSVMNFGYFRDVILSFGWKENPNKYTNCLDALERIEDELIDEDVVTRDVRRSIHIFKNFTKDLISILRHGNDNELIAVATSVLEQLSLPVELNSTFEEAMLTGRTQHIQKQLLSASFEIRRSFLCDAATFPVVTMLKEAMVKSEKHNVPLSEDDCIHLKNCLRLLRNILVIPGKSDLIDKTSYNIHDWQSLRNKLIWNLFVQGLDGALLLMLNSKYRAHWTSQLANIIVLLYKDQNLSKMALEALESISSASDTSCDEEESDGSKNSSTSLSSEPCKTSKVSSDSGCALASGTSPPVSDINNFIRKELHFENHKSQLDFNSSDIQTKLEKVQISDDSEPPGNVKNSYSKQNNFLQTFEYEDVDSESSSSCESPHHKKIKGSTSIKGNEEEILMSEGTDYSSKEDSGVTENMDCSSPDIQGKSSDDDIDDKKSIKNFKAVQKLRSLQMHSKVSESDSSNEDMQNVKIKYRSHPPAGRRGKSPWRNNGCIPSICMDSAIAASVATGRVKYPLLEKRNSVTTLVDINSRTPSNEDIGNLTKEFIMSFLHSGLSLLVQDLKTSILEKSSVEKDKTYLFFILSYFLEPASKVHLNVDHIRDILNADTIGYLVFECVLAFENFELHSEADIEIKRHFFDQVIYSVNALKTMMITIDFYSRKSCSQKDKTFFSDLCGKLALLQQLRNLPILLFQNWFLLNIPCFMEDVVILNHYILTVTEKGMELHPETMKNTFVYHLRNFSSKKVIATYGLLLENYKCNSNILNECLFTMMHHIAGDVRASNSLIEPSLLKTFSSILKEDVELEPYQEDLIMYILNKFSLQVKKNRLKEKKDEEGECSGSSDHTSSSSSTVISDCLLSEDDDLFWWYLQFEQDKDPIGRISEHITSSKRDILSKLQLKGIISAEKYESLEAKMKITEETSDELSCDLVEMENFDDEITHLLRNLVQSGRRQHLIWIQDTLLEACYVKLGLKAHIPEPVPYFSLKNMSPVPLVPCTEEQRKILKDEMFLQLLKKIGFDLGNSMCPKFPRIPLFWTADVLFAIAARLGPVRKDKLKFSYEELLLADPNHDSITSRVPPCSTLPPLSSFCTLSSWLASVRSKNDQKQADVN